ncbi:hypothetical protein DFJ77DRAFT_191141 [Powellomyces hirtus]|nr:hypothetical protein DFJ77DRAFT_191141 [Powellomyces hirtus]
MSLKAAEEPPPPLLPPRGPQPTISPRRESLPSVSEFQRQHAQEAMLQQAETEVDNAMRKVVEHVRTEIMAAVDDFTVLHAMTGVARDTYTDFNETAQDLIAGMGKVQKTYFEIDAQLEQISELENQMSSMEQVVTELDEYTKQLEESLRKRR